MTALDAAAKRATLGDGSTLGYDAALLATGGIPKRLSVPGGDLEGVFTLRHQPDMDAIVTASEETARVLVIGTSFIGMEVAGALTQRGCRVVVAGPETLPFEGQFGPDVARALLRAHEEKGVAFHLGRNIVRLEGEGRVAAAILDNGERIEAGAVVVGIGVTPATGFVSGVRKAEDGGILVDAQLRAADGLFAAGDIAALPGTDGKPRRIEHWRVAEQHGRAAARAMLGHAAPFDGCRSSGPRSTTRWWTTSATRANGTKSLSMATSPASTSSASISRADASPRSRPPAATGRPRCSPN